MSPSSGTPAMTAHDEATVSRPAAHLLLLESRVWAELGWLAVRSRRLTAQLPRGDGHAVLIVPGFGASDLATAPLRSLLKKLGYAAYGWGLGANLGMRPAIKQAMGLQLHKLAERHGPVSLIGWSLGGVYVREMARHAPEQVRRVMTLGSPINVRPDANNLMPVFQLINRGKPVKVDLEGFRKRIAPPPVPCTAIYTRSDGIVAWRCCQEPEAPNTENVEVRGSHLGLVYNARAIRAIAERLARPG